MPTIYGDGEQTRDFVNVSDAVDALITSMNAKPTGFRCYNVASGTWITINSLLQTLCSLTGTLFDPKYEGEQVGDLRHSQANIASIRADLNFSPRVNLKSGLTQLIDEFGERKKTAL